MAMYNGANGVEYGALTTGTSTSELTVNKNLTDDAVGKIIPVFRDASDQSTNMFSYFFTDTGFFRMDKDGTLKVLGSGGYGGNPPFGNNITGSYNGNGNNLYILNYYASEMRLFKIENGAATVKSFSAGTGNQVKSAAIDILNNVWFTIENDGNLYKMPITQFVSGDFVSTKFPVTGLDSATKVQLLPKGDKIYLVLGIGANGTIVAHFNGTSIVEYGASLQTGIDDAKIFDSGIIIGKSGTALIRIIAPPKPTDTPSYKTFDLNHEISSLSLKCGDGHFDLYMFLKGPTYNGLYYVDNADSKTDTSSFLTSLATSGHCLKSNVEYNAVGTNYTGHLAI